LCKLPLAQYENWLCSADFHSTGHSVTSGDTPRHPHVGETWKITRFVFVGVARFSGPRDLTVG
jgi:hypothetical protein